MFIFPNQDTMRGFLVSNTHYKTCILCTQKNHLIETVLFKQDPPVMLELRNRESKFPTCNLSWRPDEFIQSVIRMPHLLGGPRLRLNVRYCDQFRPASAVRPSSIFCRPLSENFFFF